MYHKCDTFRCDTAALPKATEGVIMQRSMNVDISTNELEYVPVDFDDPQTLLEHAKKLEGHTFREV